MVLSKIPVKFYFDVISPYSYFAFETIHRYKPIWKSMDLQWKPVHLFALLKESENSPPILNETKKRQLVTDMKILPKFFQVPLYFPSNFIDIAMSRNVIPPQRFIVSVQQQIAKQNDDTDLVTELIRKLYSEVFKSEGELIPLTDHNRLRLIAKAAGLSNSIIDSSLQQIDSQEVKDELRDNVKAATAAGAFGTPSIVAHCPDWEKPQLIFGSDRIEILAYLLKEKYSGPVPSA